MGNMQSNTSGTPENFGSLIQAIRKELDNEIYNSFIDRSIVLESLTLVDKYHVCQENLQELITLVLDYMTLIKNHFSEPEAALETSFKKDNFVIQFAEKYFKIKNQTFFQNKNILKIFKYICPVEGQQSFMDLKFDLNVDEIRKVQKKIKELCQYDLRGFTFLTTYLTRSAQKLEKQLQKTPEQISQAIVSGLNALLRQYDLQNQGDGSSKEALKRNLLNLNQIEQGAQKNNLLQRFLQENQKQYFLDFDKIRQILMELLKKHEFSTDQEIILQNLNIKSAQKSAIFRSSERVLSKEEDEDLQLSFRLNDILRNKNRFSSLRQDQKISSFINDLKNQIILKGLTLEQVNSKQKYRVDSSNIEIRLNPNSKKASLQLQMNLNGPVYVWIYKLYQIIILGFFSPLTALKFVHQQFLQSLITEARQIINFNALWQNNNRNESAGYDLPLNFTTLKTYFDQFVKTLSNEEDSNSAPKFNPSKLKSLAKRFSSIKEVLSIQSDIQKKFNNGLFMFTMKNYQKAEAQFLDFISIFQKEYLNLLRNVQFNSNHRSLQPLEETLLRKYAKGFQYLGLSHKQIGKANQAIKNFKLFEQILSKVSNNELQLIENIEYIAEIYNKEGNYLKAFDHYKQSLKQKIQYYGQNTLQVANTLNNIGLFHKMYGKYPQALEYYDRSLKIKEKLTGKDSYECSVTILNIGNVYKNSQQYPKALEEYNRCLQIQERVKGKNSIDCAATFDNLGVIMRATFRLTDAIYYHKRAADIIQSVLGKDSDSLASVYNNIGFVYRLMLKFDESFKYHFKALEIKEKIKGKQNVDLTNTIMNIGVALALQGKLEEALEYHKRAAKIRWTVEGQKSHAAAQNENEVGYVYQLMGKYDEAMQSYMKCLKVYIQIKGKCSPDWSITAVNVGTILIQQGKYQEALQYLKQSADNFLKIKGRSVSYATALYPLGKLYRKTNKLDDAIQNLVEAFNIFNSMEYKQFRLGQVCTQLGDVYSQKGDYEKAIYYYQQAPNLVVFEWNYVDNLKKKAQCHKKFNHLDLHDKTLQQIKTLEAKNA